MVTDTLVFRSLVVYGGYLAASWLAYAAGNELLLFFWPHLVGLALQDFGGASEPGVIGLQVLGVLVVSGSALAVRRLAQRATGWTAAFVLVPCCLAAFTLIAFGLAYLLGWSYGV